MANPTIEHVYHIEIFDESGARLEVNNLDRVELDEFRHCHETDDLDYRYYRDLPKACKVRAHHA